MKIHLTPQHQVDLSPEFYELVTHAPRQDVIIRTIAQKMANGQPLIQADLVVAGEQTRMDYPLSKTYPVHFRKTYYPTAFHPHPELEFAKHQRAAQILKIPPPIGASGREFRSCFIPGQMLKKLTPFGVEPSTANLKIAREANPALLIGIWQLLEGVYDQLTALHLSGMCHGDVFFHNVVIPHSPIGVYLIDFEQAVLLEDQKDPSAWPSICEKDLDELFTHAIYVQCGLGYQKGALASACVEKVEELMGSDAPTFLRAMDHA